MAMRFELATMSGSSNQRSTAAAWDIEWIMRLPKADTDLGLTTRIRVAVQCAQPREDAA